MADKEAVMRCLKCGEEHLCRTQEEHLAWVKEHRATAHPDFKGSLQYTGRYVGQTTKSDFTNT